MAALDRCATGVLAVAYEPGRCAVARTAVMRERPMRRRPCRPLCESVSDAPQGVPAAIGRCPLSAACARRWELSVAVGGV